MITTGKYTQRPILIPKEATQKPLLGSLVERSEALGPKGDSRILPLKGGPVLEPQYYPKRGALF